MLIKFNNLQDLNNLFSFVLKVYDHAASVESNTNDALY